jgi:hypothetical protein
MGWPATTFPRPLARWCHWRVDHLYNVSSGRRAGRQAMAGPRMHGVLEHLLLDEPLPRVPGPACQTTRRAPSVSGRRTQAAGQAPLSQGCDCPGSEARVCNIAQSARRAPQHAHVWPDSAFLL